MAEENAWSVVISIRYCVFFLSGLDRRIWRQSWGCGKVRAPRPLASGLAVIKAPEEQNVSRARRYTDSLPAARPHTSVRRARCERYFQSLSLPYKKQPIPSLKLTISNSPSQSQGMADAESTRHFFWEKREVTERRKRHLS